MREFQRIDLGECGEEFFFVPLLNRVYNIIIHIFPWNDASIIIDLHEDDCSEYRMCDTQSIFEDDSEYDSIIQAFATWRNN